MRVVGIDPGASGALALWRPDGLVAAIDMPVLMLRRGKSDKAEVDAAGIIDVLAEWRPTHVVIEQVGGIPGQSAPAAFNFGRAAGAVEYIARALRYPVAMVPPATWKKALRVNGGKDGSRAAAVNLWPQHRALFARVKDDGRAEAALIAYWFGREAAARSNVLD